MKKYSRFDLLNNAIIGNTGQVINRLFESKYARLTIPIPVYDLKRAAVFVGTVNELIEEETDELFSIEKLIVLLYEDFLKQIDRGMDIDTLASAIEHKISEFRKVEMKVSHYLEQEPGDINLDDFKRHLKKQKKNDIPFTYFSFRILKKYVLKGEVLLHDLNDVYPSIRLDVEELIALRFRDVMSQIKAGNYQILANIVQRLTIE